MEEPSQTRCYQALLRRSHQHRHAVSDMPFPIECPKIQLLASFVREEQQPPAPRLRLQSSKARARQKQRQNLALHLLALRLMLLLRLLLLKSLVLRQ